MKRNIMLSMTVLAALLTLTPAFAREQSSDRQGTRHRATVTRASAAHAGEFRGNRHQQPGDDQGRRAESGDDHGHRGGGRR